jgi:hypothetical protein
MARLRKFAPPRREGRKERQKQEGECRFLQYRKTRYEGFRFFTTKHTKYTNEEKL